MKGMPKYKVGETVYSAWIDRGRVKLWKGEVTAVSNKRDRRICVCWNNDECEHDWIDVDRASRTTGDAIRRLRSVLLNHISRVADELRMLDAHDGKVTKGKPTVPYRVRGKVVGL